MLYTIKMQINQTNPTKSELIESEVQHVLITGKHSSWQIKKIEERSLHPYTLYSVELIYSEVL